MIGFVPQGTTRRPIYSVTGEKLCYLECGPGGEWVTTLDGRRYARLTRRHKAWIANLSATQVMGSGLMISPEETYER